MLPPRWGQAVAPPPTPLFTPQTSPRSVTALDSDTQMEVYFERGDPGVQAHPPPPLVAPSQSGQDFGGTFRSDRVSLHRQVSNVINTRFFVFRRFYLAELSRFHCGF